MAGFLLLNLCFTTMMPTATLVIVVAMLCQAEQPYFIRMSPVTNRILRFKLALLCP